MMMSCKDVSVLVSASLDRRLSAWERLKVRTHLLICKGCTNFSRQMSVLHAATQRLAEGEEMDGLAWARLPDDAHARIRDTLREHRHRGEDRD